eukprot:10638199-Heterocapsa_arctica.AAC.1
MDSDQGLGEQMAKAIPGERDRARSERRGDKALSPHVDPNRTPRQFEADPQGALTIPGGGMWGTNPSRTWKSWLQQDGNMR